MGLHPCIDKGLLVTCCQSPEFEMAYNVKQEYLRHFRRIVTEPAVVKGRSSRTEFLAFLILVALVYGMALVLAEVAAHGSMLRYEQYLSIALWLPAIPLFARRLHDQNRSGWLALILPAVLALQLYALIPFDSHQLPVPRLGIPFNVADFLLVAALWVLVVWPGTAGENRFGADPRLDPAADLL